jgi:hypothetical protein
LTTVIATGVTGGSLIETPPAGDQFFYWDQVQ